MPIERRNFTFTDDEVRVVRAALRLFETTMNLDEMIEDTDNDLARCLEGKLPGPTTVRGLCQMLGVYEVEHEDGTSIQPFFEDDA